MSNKSFEQGLCWRFIVYWETIIDFWEHLALFSPFLGIFLVFYREIGD